MAQINPNPALTSPMASECKRKRHANPSTQAGPPAKRRKFTEERRPTNFPPSFWDNLSKVSLTTRALRELDRRNEEQQHSPIPTASGGVVPRDKARFARHGGPDLRHLRGFPAPMASTQSSKTSRRTQSTEATSVGNRSSKSSAYNKNFQEHLIDHGVYPAGYEYDDDYTDAEPRNLDHLYDQLLVPRASLSPSTFPQSKFRDFQKKNNQATFESDVMRTVLPILGGDHNDIHNQQNVLFTELEPITNDKAVKPKPDFFDGASLQDFNQELRRDQKLRSTIIPTKHPAVPVAPNFFCEAKGPDGNAAVVQRQACYDGAYGVRAMHALQNYKKPEPLYDGNAYTMSSTYHAGTGTLQLYSHHVTAPSTAEGRPEYHMTQLDTWGMTGNIDSFRRGATAFRNAREMAERYRGAFIQAANTRAAPAATMDNAGITVAHEETSASAQLEAFELADSSEYGAWQDADNALQQLIADGEGEPLQGEAETTAMPRYLPAEEDSQNLSQDSGPQDHDDPSLSFASGFASSLTSFDTEALRPKRPRQSLSPPTKSKRTLPSTKGQGADTRQVIQPYAPTVQLSSGSGKSHWVGTYARKGKICFKNTEQQEVKTESEDWLEQTINGTRCFYWQSPKSGRSFWATELPSQAKEGEHRRQRSSK